MSQQARYNSRAERVRTIDAKIARLRTRLREVDPESKEAAAFKGVLAGVLDLLDEEL